VVWIKPGGRLPRLEDEGPGTYGVLVGEARYEVSAVPIDYGGHIEDAWRHSS